MEVKTYTVYNYDELSPEAKKKAVEWAQERLREDDFYFENIKNQWCEKLEVFGFTDVSIAFTGFWSQGDGASFTGKCDMVKFIRATKQAKKYSKVLYHIENGNLDLSGESYRISHHYCHENTVAGRLDIQWYGSREIEMRAELEDSLTDFIRTNSKKIYRELESAYDAQTSEESAIDFLENYEYTFLENGERSD